MAHFAELDKDNNVLSVAVIANDVLMVDGEELEIAGIDFLETIYGHRNWKQTSYNGSFRKNYAFEGCVYDTEWDAFRTPQPYPSWKLNYETFKWEAPIPKPDYEAGYIWRWGEINQEWVKYQVPFDTAGKN